MKEVYPDEQQLFIGSLKSFMTKEILMRHFEHYGRVIDVEIINSRDERKSDFGFVIFDEAETAKLVLGDLVSLFLLSALLILNICLFSKYAKF